MSSPAYRAAPARNPREVDGGETAGGCERDAPTRRAHPRDGRNTAKGETRIPRTSPRELRRQACGQVARTVRCAGLVRELRRTPATNDPHGRRPRVNCGGVKALKKPHGRAGQGVGAQRPAQRRSGIVRVHRGIARTARRDRRTSKGRTSTKPHERRLAGLSASPSRRRAVTGEADRHAGESRGPFQERPERERGAEASAATSGTTHPTHHEEGRKRRARPPARGHPGKAIGRRGSDGERPLWRAKSHGRRWRRGQR